MHIILELWSLDPFSDILRDKIGRGWAFQYKAVKYTCLAVDIQHQQKCVLNISEYITIYSNKFHVNFEIPAFRYMRIQRTSKLYATTINVNFTISANTCKGPH